MITLIIFNVMLDQICWVWIGWSWSEDRPPGTFKTNPVKRKQNEKLNIGLINRPGLMIGRSLTGGLPGGRSLSGFSACCWPLNVYDRGLWHHNPWEGQVGLFHQSQWASPVSAVPPSLPGEPDLPVWKASLWIPLEFRTPVESIMMRFKWPAFLSSLL